MLDTHCACYCYLIKTDLPAGVFWQSESVKIYA